MLGARKLLQEKTNVIIGTVKFRQLLIVINYYVLSKLLINKLLIYVLIYNGTNIVLVLWLEGIKGDP